MSYTEAVSGDVEARSYTPARGMDRGRPIAFFVVLLLLTAGSLYGALAVLVRIDTLLLPGNAVALPHRLARLPGLEPAAADAGQPTDRINILVLGVDRRPHHDPKVDGPPRTDSMYIVSLDPLTRSGSVVAIPRDLYVEVPNPRGGAGYWDTRINTAYHYGALYKYPGGGAALARATVEHNFKVKIHYYAVVDWVAFAEIVDALGGVEVMVPAPLRRVEGFNVRTGAAVPLSIPAGRVTMDGTTALAYARYRDDPDGDFGRIRRQQQVMTAVMEKALALGWLGRAPALYTRFRGAIDTDASAAKLPGLAALANQIGPEGVQMVSLAGERGENVTRRITPYGEDVLVPVWERMGPTLAAVIPDRRLQEEHAVVKLVNAAGSRGLATRSAATLARYGLDPSDVLPYDNANAERRSTTSVTVYGDKEYTAQRIAELLGVPRAPIQQRDEAARLAGEPDIVVMLGLDVRLPDSSRFDTFTPR